MNPGSRYVQLLRAQARQPNLNNGSTAGGLAHVLQQTQNGFMYDRMRKEHELRKRQQQEAYMAQAQGLTAKPWVDPDTGVARPGQNVGGFGGAQQALGQLQGNPYTGKMAADLAIRQAQAQQDQQAQQRKFAQQSKLAEQRNAATRQNLLDRAAQQQMLSQHQGSMADYYARGRQYEQAVRELRGKGMPDEVIMQQIGPPPQAPQMGGAPMGGSPQVPQPPQMGAAPQEPQAPFELGPYDPAAAEEPPEQPPATIQEWNELQRQRDLQTVKDTATATADAKAESKKRANITKARNSLGGLERQTKVLTKTIDDALQTVSGWSTGYGNLLLSQLPNTDARKLDNYLTTIKANLGFDKLQQMRDASPTGGALGQVSEMENKLLQAVNGALDPLQRDQLVQNLTSIRDLYPQVLAERRSAFESDYGQQPAGPAPSQAPQGDITEADIQETMRANSMTREEVMQRLGGQ